MQRSHLVPAARLGPPRALREEGLRDTSASASAPVPSQPRTTCLTHLSMALRCLCRSGQRTRALHSANTSPSGPRPNTHAALIRSHALDNRPCARLLTRSSCSTQLPSEGGRDAPCSLIPLRGNTVFSRKSTQLLILIILKTNSITWVELSRQVGLRHTPIRYKCTYLQVKPSARNLR